jgi:hypothetical protein
VGLVVVVEVREGEREARRVLEGRAESELRRWREPRWGRELWALTVEGIERRGDWIASFLGLEIAMEFLLGGFADLRTLVVLRRFVGDAVAETRLRRVGAILVGMFVVEVGQQADAGDGYGDVYLCTSTLW